jgi:hypothetical protein
LVPHFSNEFSIFSLTTNNITTSLEGILCFPIELSHITIPIELSHINI